jgi:hypothetical protein
MDREDDDYEVGYGRPPQETRWQKGQSGNPKGRPPRRARTVTEIYAEVANELIEVTENGHKKLITKVEAMIRREANESLSQNQKARKEFLTQVRQAERQEDTDEDFEQEKVLQASMLERFEEARRLKAEREVAVAEDKPAEEDPDVSRS